MKLLFNTSTLDPKVCAAPVFLNTLNIFSLSKTFSIFSISVVLPTPILTDPPIETVGGILLTKISWTRPLKWPTVIDLPSETVSVLTPTWKESVKYGIEVLNPDMNTVSLSLSSIKGETLTSTSLKPFQVNTALLKRDKLVSILDIPIPTISETSALNPVPSVLSWSNDVISPTL